MTEIAHDDEIAGIALNRRVHQVYPGKIEREE
jgi:hypothetical protein